jgi:hypothetical protein
MVAVTSLRQADVAHPEDSLNRSQLHVRTVNARVSAAVEPGNLVLMPPRVAYPPQLLHVLLSPLLLLCRPIRYWTCHAKLADICQMSHHRHSSAMQPQRADSTELQTKVPGSSKRIDKLAPTV